MTKTNIFQKNITPFMFQSQDAKLIMTYARQKYGDYVEFLWERFPKYAVLRRSDTHKWYATLMGVKGSQISLPQITEMEVVNLHANPKIIEALIADGIALPAYHMNKTHWMTIPLDGRLSCAKLHQLIDISYQLAIK